MVINKRRVPDWAHYIHSMATGIKQLRQANKLIDLDVKNAGDLDAQTIQTPQLHWEN